MHQRSDEANRGTKEGRKERQQARKQGRKEGMKEGRKQEYAEEEEEEEEEHGEKNPGDPEGRGEGEGEVGSCKKHRCKQVRSHLQLSEQDYQNYGYGRRQGRVDHNAFCQSYFLLGNVTIKCL